MGLRGRAQGRGPELGQQVMRAEGRDGQEELGTKEQEGGRTEGQNPGNRRAGSREEHSCKNNSAVKLCPFGGFRKTSPGPTNLGFSATSNGGHWGLFAWSSLTNLTVLNLLQLK